MTERRESEAIAKSKARRKSQRLWWANRQQCHANKLPQEFEWSLLLSIVCRWRACNLYVTRGAPNSPGKVCSEIEALLCHAS